VTLDQNAVVAGLSHGAASGRQTLEVRGAALTLTGAGRVSPNGRLELAQNGSLDGQGQLLVEGVLETGRGFLRGSGLLRIASGGRLLATNSLVALTLERSLENAGEIHFGGGGFITLTAAGITNLASATMRLLDGAWLLATGDGRLINHGNLPVAGTNSVRLQNLRFEQAGSFAASNAPVEIFGGEVAFTPSGDSQFGRELQIVSGAEVTVQHAIQTRDIVTVRSGVLRLETDLALPKLVMAGTLDGTGALLVREHLTLQNATLAGPGELRLAPGATGTIDGALRLARPLINDGFVACAPGAVLLFDDGLLENRGEFEFSGAASFSWQRLVAGNRFLNTGTLLHPTTNVVSFDRVHFENRGEVQLTAGALNLNWGADFQSSMEVPAGASLRLGRAVILAPGVALQGTGVIAFEGGEHDLHGRFLPAGSFALAQSASVTVRNPLPPTARADLRNSTLRFESDQVVQGLTLQSGTIAGPGRVTVTDAMRWMGGRLDNGPVFTLASNATLEVGNNANILARPFSNRGEISMADNAQLWFENSTLTNAGTLRLPGTATFTWNIASSLTNFLVNLGRIEKTGTNKVSFARVRFHNEGQFVIAGGQLEFNAGAENRTAMIAPSGSTLTFNSPFLSTIGSTIGGAGALHFGSGAHEIAGAFLPTGLVEIAVGTLQVEPAFTHAGTLRLRSGRMITEAPAVLGELEHLGGTLEINGGVTLAGRGIWQGGNLEGAEAFRVAPAAELVVTNTTAKALTTDVEISGLLRFSAVRNLGVTGAALRILAAGEFRLAGTNELYRAGTVAAALRNEGLMVMDSSNSVLRLTRSLAFEQAGELNLAAGRLESDTSAWSGQTTIGRPAVMDLGSATHSILQGAVFAGDGSLDFGNSARIELLAPLDLGALEVIFGSDVRVTGAFLLSNRSGGRWTTGARTAIAGPVSIGGILEVPSAQTLTIGDALTLQAGGEILNHGTLSAVTFTNLGGVVGPNPVTETGAALPVVLSVRSLPERARRHSGAVGPEQMQIHWVGTPGAMHIVEISSDLRTWQGYAWVTAPPDGVCILPLSEASQSPARFLRVRHVP
jgi:hypothetical protein